MLLTLWKVNRHLTILNLGKSNIEKTLVLMPNLYSAFCEVNYTIMSYCTSTVVHKAVNYAICTDRYLLSLVIFTYFLNLLLRLYQWLSSLC